MKRAATTVARTGLQHTAVQARLATYEKNKKYFDGVMLVATLDSRTCIGKNQIVNLYNGKTKKIQDIAYGDEVISHLGKKRKVLAAEKTGKKEVIRVVFSDGREIIATPDHKIWTGDQWKTLEELIQTTA
jgi:hypothetical protein